MTYPHGWFVYLIHHRDLGRPVLMVHRDEARRPYVDRRFLGSLHRATNYPWHALAFPVEREAREWLALFLPPSQRDPEYAYVVSDLSAREAADRQRMRHRERGIIQCPV